MNNNIAAYCIYLAITLFLIWQVGKMCYRNGRHFILQLYGGDAQSTDTINNILLVAYYLFNTGYAFIRLTLWEQVRSAAQLIETLGRHIGVLVLILAVTHYFNILLIFFLSRKHSTLTPKY